MKKGDAYPPKHLSAATFGNKPRVFTIECVRMEKFDNDGKVTEKPEMYFKGERSGLVLGPVKWDQVCEALDEEDSDRWPGLNLPRHYALRRQEGADDLGA